MIQDKTFAIVGGDLRQAHMANALAGRESGERVYAMFLEKDVKLSGKIVRTNDVKLVMPQSDIVVLPLPMLGSNGVVNTPLSGERLIWDDCLEYILPETVVLGGMIPPCTVEAAREKGVEMIDYFQREEFAVLNAVPTAEGAVEIALGEMPVTLFGSTCLITGFGRIARALAKLLCAFGADVRVVARKYSDLAWARVYGCTAVHLSELSAHLKDVDVLFNTVPAVILDEEKLAQLGRKCLVIDLASKPGGVDFETAKNLGLKTIWALSLPGRVAPVSSGEIILNTVFNILQERGIA